MEDAAESPLLNWLDVAWNNVGFGSLDLDIPDVIRYADIAWQWDDFRAKLDHDFQSDRYHPTGVEIVDLPKDRLTVRPLARLEIGHRLIYEALVASAASSVKKAISPRVYSSRWWVQRERFVNPIGSWVQMQKDARSYHLRNVRHQLAQTDISSFFEHIDIGILVDDLRHLNVSTWTVDALEAFLTAFNNLSNAWGIPQGSDMSGILANLYLASLDSDFRRSGYRHFRYSDDIYIFGRDWTTLRSALINANKSLRHRHLNLAGSKTKIIRSADILGHLEDREKDAIKYGIEIGAPRAVAEVRDLFDRAVVDDPVTVRDIKFSLTNLAKLRDDYAVSWVVKNLIEIPHAAREAMVYLDRFARLDSKIGDAVADLFVDKVFATYPFAQQHILIFLIRNSISSRRLADEAWAILSDKNAEAFVREMAARYLGLRGPSGEGGGLKQIYQEEDHLRVRRALLIACYESKQSTERWLKVVSGSDPSLYWTARYLRSSPTFIPYPEVKRKRWS
jgi:hypothetical protein